MSTTSAKFCPAQWAVAGTMRQYWMCDLPAGHTGDHVTFWGETGRVRSQHPARRAEPDSTERASA